MAKNDTVMACQAENNPDTVASNWSLTQMEGQDPDGLTPGRELEAFFLAVFALVPL